MRRDTNSMDATQLLHREDLESKGMHPGQLLASQAECLLSISETIQSCHGRQPGHKQIPERPIMRCRQHVPAGALNADKIDRSSHQSDKLAISRERRFSSREPVNPQQNSRVKHHLAFGTRWWSSLLRGRRTTLRRIASDKYGIRIPTPRRIRAVAIPGEIKCDYWPWERWLGSASPRRQTRGCRYRQCWGQWGSRKRRVRWIDWTWI